MKTKLLIIDRDGTIIREPSDFQIDSFEKLEFMPGVFTWLGKIANELDFKLIMATNQDGLGTESFPEASFWGPHNLMLKTLKSQEIEFDEVLIDKSFEEEQKSTRKPRTGMFKDYLNENFDLENSFVIGDRPTDAQLAINLGCKSIQFENKTQSIANYTVSNWEEIYNLLKGSRRASVTRKTNETEITVSVNLDTDGKSSISTGIGFFDHMLEQIARHAGIELSISCIGDLTVDEHHSIEDVAITFGKAVKEAIGIKKGIARYGFALPMDDSWAKVLLDLGGRPYFKWKCKFKREKIGDLPTEMLPHFFESLAFALEANIHIKAKGKNEHHKAEAIFKAFAKALMQAKAIEGNSLPSTKGII